jgi:hypothetical protein
MCRRRRVQGRYLIFASRREDTNYLSASICGLTRPIDRNDHVYEVLAANKDAIDEVCGEEAVAARRLERLREKDQERQDLQEETRELLEQDD